METLKHDVPANQVYSINRPPHWVKANEFDSAEALNHHDSPYFYLLLDYQERVENACIQSYCHTVQKINDSSRIEDASLNLRDLNANNQHLVFHRLDIIRDGQRLPALNEENIEVYQREKSLEAHVVDRLLTISSSIDDLRTGDIIDFETTLLDRASEHPLWVKHYYAFFWLDWDCLVLQQTVRVINDSTKALNLLSHRIENGNTVDTHERIDPAATFENHFTGLTPKSIASTAPAWLWTDFLQFTSEMTWRDISAYLYRYYLGSGALGAKLDIDKIDRISLVGVQRADALRVIRFVQNGIRYHGENHGVYTHTPKQPPYVLHKSAGDCKDKSSLLVALLDSIGVDANLVLVNTRYGKGIAQRNPSAYHFNHMIVRVRLDGEDYYFDPTAQKQAGDFEHAAQLNYGYVLNLNALGEDLVEMPYQLPREVYRLTHRFDLSAAEQGQGRLTITRKYLAHRADNLRYHLDARETSEVEQRYLDWARDDTELKLSVINAFRVIEDSRDENFLLTEERYEILNLAQYAADDWIRVSTNFYHDYPVPSRDRFPLQIGADGACEHRLEVHYCCNPDIGPTSEQFSNRYFAYRDWVWREGHVLKFSTRTTPYREVVERSELRQYEKDVQRMYQRSGNSFPCMPQPESRPVWSVLAGACLLASLIAALLA